MKFSEELLEKIFHTSVLSLFTLGLYFEIPKYLLVLGSSTNFSVTNVFMYQGISYLLIPTSAYFLAKIWLSNQFISKNNINIYYIIYAFVVISFIFAYAMLDLGKRLSEIPTVRIGSADGWLAFIGSVIGGVITMVAVVFTINNEKEIRNSESKMKEKEQALKSTPVLQLDNKNKRNVSAMRMNKSNKRFIHFLYSYEFNIINTSDYFAILDGFEVISTKVLGLFALEEDSRGINFRIDFDYPIGSLLPPKFVIPISIRLYGEVENLSTISLNFTLRYSDISNYSHYLVKSSQKIEISFVASEDLDNYITPFDDIVLDANEEFVRIEINDFENKFSNLNN